MAKTIITLGREYCTGGRYIAKDVRAHWASSSTTRS